MSDFEPFYDVKHSYEDNYEQGPFGAFAEALKATPSVTSGDSSPYEGELEKKTSDGVVGEPGSAAFLGQPVNLPFGIPAGPLLNSRFTTAAFRMGFGVPSQSPDVWQPDMRAAIASAGLGQVLVPSFQGSRVEGMSEEEYIADHATTARLIKETGAKLMVMNTSCPNEGHNRLLCHNPLLVGRITEAVKQEIGDIPLMVKLAYIPSDDDLELMVRSTVGHGTVQGFSTINTISAKLVDADGNQALPGAGRDRSGVCGNAIRGAGLDMVARLAAIREKLGLDFKINGVGGVVSPADYQAYRNAGADSVMSATGAMWDAELARKIKSSIK